MTKSLKVAVVGATSLVGREIVRVIAERGFPAGELLALSTEDVPAAAIELGDGDEPVPVRKVDAAAFAGVDLVLMAAGSIAARELAPLATRAGAVVIDNSSAWRMDDGVPLIVPEVNAADIAQLPERRIIASPSDSTIHLVAALAPLHRAATLRHMTVATYQAVSGEGQPGMDELGEQVQALFGQREITPAVFPKRIAFNCLPQIGEVLDDGFTREEHAIVEECRKVLHAPKLEVCATCVRVPVFNGNSAAVVADFATAMDVATARELLRQAPGLMLIDERATGTYPTPADVEGSDAVFVGRLRHNPAAANSLAFWCVADSVRKGAASNAVQIAEIVARTHF